MDEEYANMGAPTRAWKAVEDFKEAEYLVIDNVAIPLELNDRFVAPDLERALEYYPAFVHHSRSDLSSQAYLCILMKEIDKAKPNGYTGEKAAGELMVYLGSARFMELVSQPRLSDG